MIPDVVIRRLISDGSIHLVPVSDSNLQPVSYDVHIGKNALIPSIDEGSAPYLDLAVSSPEMIQISIPTRDDPEILTIDPQEFMLVETKEYLELDYDVAAELDGKSTLGRAGLLIHATAGLIDPGWRGHITCELYNLSRRRIRLWQGMPIGQFVFHRLVVPVDRPYGHNGLNSHYQFAKSVEGSKPLGLENAR